MGSGKLKGLFAKKEGGSTIGNALRFVGDKFTGGLYSDMFPKPTDNDLKTKIPTTVVNAQPSSEEVQNANDKLAQKEATMDKVKKYLPIVGAVIAVVVVIGLIVKRKKKK